jgi:hypothetical protein
MEKLKAGNPVTSGTLTFIPIERVAVYGGQTDIGYWANAYKLPHTVVICGANGVHALDLNSAPVSMDELTEAVPNLKALLESLKD